MQQMGIPIQNPTVKSFGATASPVITPTPTAATVPAGVEQARLAPVDLASALQALAAQVQQLASQLTTTAPRPATDGYASPRVTDSNARTNALARRDDDRVVVSNGRGHTLRQVADRNLALQGWAGASKQQVAQEAKRLAGLNGIRKVDARLGGHVVLSDNGMKQAETVRLRRRLDQPGTAPAAKRSPAAKDAGSAKEPSKQAAKPPSKQSPTSGGGDIAPTANITVKGRKASVEQRRNLDAVLDVGTRMGASDKVQQAAVATVIQESNAQNLDHGDRDSLGLFQQRPSMGWGTRAQVRDPEHAARKFYEQAIPADRRSPSKSITQLAQTVQRSGFPGAYAQWSGEAKRIVAAWKAGD